MTAFWVVKHFYVIKHILLDFAARSVSLAADKFPFKQLEKTFSNCVVVTVAALAHAWFQIVYFQKRLPVIAAELTALVFLLLLVLAPC